MKTPNHLLIVVLLFLFSLVHLGCPDNKPADVISPQVPTNCEYSAGNRNISWKLDTVAWWPSTLGGVHAFSDSDAWVMGDMYGPVINGKNTSYVGLHWNGKSWNEKIDFLNILMKANDVTGDDHFMVAAGYLLYVGEKPAIAEFDNRTKKWKSYQFQTAGELRSVWTDGKGYFIAVGDNGMVYIKDGYTAEWEYNKAPTEFNLLRVSGIEKSELYILGGYNIPGKHFQQIWKLSKNIWIKLLDNLDTVKTPIEITESGDEINDIAAFRCSVSDSLFLFVGGAESFIFETKGNDLSFRKTNLSIKGLPISSLNKAVSRITIFTPNDIWISSLRYYLYHWNGSNFQKTEPISTLPYENLWGYFSRVTRSSSGKTWMILEMNSQVYAVLQALPK